MSSQEDVDEGSLASGSDGGELSDQSDEVDNEESMDIDDDHDDAASHSDQLQNNEGINEEVDAASSDADEEGGEPSSSLEVPGMLGTPCYALLVGMIDPSTKTEESSNNEIISIPITRLPVTLGKEHDTRDPSFIGLQESSAEEASGNALKLSQSMCCI